MWWRVRDGEETLCIIPGSVCQHSKDEARALVVLGSPPNARVGGMNDPTHPPTERVLMNIYRAGARAFGAFGTRPKCF